MMLKDFVRNGNRFWRTFAECSPWAVGRRFAQWATGTVLCCEEHTITQILTGLGLEDQWRNVEHFAEYGAWDREAVERQLMQLVEREHPARWGRYHPVAIDDTKEHRTSADVWGTCTFHESGARSPNRATTVRAHNWVVMGDLAPGKPWTYMPTASRLYFRKSQLPAGERFRTKTAMAVEMLRETDAESAAPILAAFDGAYAMETVVKPCLNPPEGRTSDRLRHAVAARCAAVRATGHIGEECRKAGVHANGVSDCPRRKSMTSGTCLGSKAEPMSTAAPARFATSACDAVGRSAAPKKSWLPLCSRCPATTNCGPRSPAPPICRQGKRFRPTADGSDRKTDSATTSNDWAWKNVGRGRRSRCCGRSKSR